MNDPDESGSTFSTRRRKIVYEYCQVCQYDTGRAATMKEEASPRGVALI